LVAISLLLKPKNTKKLLHGKRDFGCIMLNKPSLHSLGEREPHRLRLDGDKFHRYFRMSFEPFDFSMKPNISLENIQTISNVICKFVHVNDPHCAIGSWSVVLRENDAKHHTAPCSAARCRIRCECSLSELYNLVDDLDSSRCITTTQTQGINRANNSINRLDRQDRGVLLPFYDQQ